MSEGRQRATRNSTPSQSGWSLIRFLSLIRFRLNSARERQTLAFPAPAFLAGFLFVFLPVFVFILVVGFVLIVVVVFVVISFIVFVFIVLVEVLVIVGLDNHQRD